MSMIMKPITTKVDGDINTPSIPDIDLTSSFSGTSLCLGNVTYQTTENATTLYGNYWSGVGTKATGFRLYVNGEDMGFMDSNRPLRLDHIYGYKISKYTPDNEVLSIDVATAPTYSFGDKQAVGRLNINPTIQYIKDNHVIYYRGNPDSNPTSEHIYGIPIFYTRYLNKNVDNEGFQILFLCCEEQTNKDNNVTWAGFTIHAYRFEAKDNYTNYILEPLAQFNNTGIVTLSARIIEPSEQANQIAAIQNDISALEASIADIRSDLDKLISNNSSFFVAR